MASTERTISIVCAEIVTIQMSQQQKKAPNTTQGNERVVRPSFGQYVRQRLGVIALTFIFTTTAVFVTYGFWLEKTDQDYVDARKAKKRDPFLENLFAIRPKIKSDNDRDK